MFSTLLYSIYASKSLLALFPSSDSHYLLCRGLFLCKKSEKKQQFIINSINILDIKQIQLYQAQYLKI